MDWKATLEEILAERRQQIGEAPSIDDLIALRAGELSDDDRQRLLEQAAVDPEVARELFAVLRFPDVSEDDSAAADDDNRAADNRDADDSTVDQRWQAMRDRMITEGDLPAGDDSTIPTVATPQATAARRSSWLPLAAMFVLGVGATLIGVNLRGPDEHTAGPNIPINLPIVELLPVDENAPTTRGSAESATLGSDAGGLVLTLDVPGLTPSTGNYSLEITRGDGTVATVEGLTPGRGNIFILTLPREQWTDGLHQLKLLDPDGQQIARFQLEVELSR